MKASLGLAAIALSVPLGTAQAEPAPNPWQFDFFGGGHYFNENNELGARDVSNATAPDHSFAFGVRLGYWVMPMVEVEVEGVGMPTEDRMGAAEQFIVGYRLNGLYQFDVHPQIKPFVLAGLGGSSNSSEKDEILLDDTDLVVHAGIGARYAVGESWGARVDLRWLLPPSSEGEGVTSDFEGLIGLYLNFGTGKQVEPTIVDEPEPAPGDKDGDGIMDDVDQCPEEPEDKDGFEDDNGCPDLDDDSDGIADAKDACPKVPESMNGVDDADGCPEGDEDGDGILGSSDKCPTDPEDKDGFEDEDGCPDGDNDKDGVPDGADKCPTEQENMNGYQDDDGCTDEVPKAVQKYTGVIKGINFKVDSADLTAGSFRTLDKALKVLIEFPGVKLEISGHTDDTGDAAHNRDLSQRRAETVKEYFVSKGIGAERLVATGYGPDKPIDPAKTKAARAKNRRVEFQLLTGGGPPEAAPAPAPTSEPPK